MEEKYLKRLYDGSEGEVQGCQCTGSELKYGGGSSEVFMEEKYLKRYNDGYEGAV